MPVNNSRILICYEDTGGGHKYAAQAVRTAIEELVPDLQGIDITVQAMLKETNILNRLFVALYNYLLRYHQNWMKYYCWFIEFYKPNQTLLWLCGTYLKDMLIKVRPSIIVSVHPMANHYIA